MPFSTQISPDLSSCATRTAIQPERVASIDVLRGLVMAIMAIDHSHLFLSSTHVDLTDPSRLDYATFFTRWITHLCAPTFIFLAGLGAALQLDRGQSKPALSAFLLKRGLWLIVLELVLTNLILFFTLGPPFLIVFWVIGASMVMLAGLIWLPRPVLAVLSVALIAGHDLTDPLRAASFGRAAPFWNLLHQLGPIYVHGHFVAFLAYPLLPWFAVMSLGYCFSMVIHLTAQRRIRVTALLGAVLITLFLVLRSFHAYGDPNTLDCGLRHSTSYQHIS